MRFHHVSQIVYVRGKRIDQYAIPVLKLWHGLVPAEYRMLTRRTVLRIVFPRQPEVDEIIPDGRHGASRMFRCTLIVPRLPWLDGVKELRVHWPRAVHDVKKHAIPAEHDKSASS